MDNIRRRKKFDEPFILPIISMKSTYEIQKNHSNSSKEIGSDIKLAWWWSIPLILIVGLIIGLTFIAFYNLPEPINTGSPGEFIASRAKKDLQEFVDIGPKVVGTAANEQTTVIYLNRKITQIIAESNGLYEIETSHQIASGGFLRETFVNVYESLQNIIVKITPKNSTSAKSILVNSHFDTVPDSPGAGDDGSMVVVMLGVLSALTKSTNVVRHPVVFLFNGAEENGLQGSHAFITQHAWAKDVAAFLNLDATGTGGKEILFQTGPNSPWIVDKYQEGAKYPYASVIGEEIFENELIPSDTDFRIFRDYGNVPGLDLAYAYNDYVYHTKYDDINVIEDGTYQHTGDNALFIIRALANADEMDDANFANDSTGGKVVFFDVFGIFLINYSETTGIVVNVVISVIAILIMVFSLRLMQKSAAVSTSHVCKQFGIVFCIQLGSLLLAIGVVVFIAFFVDAIGYSLSWFSETWMIFGLYFCPFIFVLGIFPALFLGWKRFNNLPLRFRIQLFLHSHCLILVLIILLLTGMSIRSAFFATQCVLFYVVALLINLATRWYCKPRIWILPILICQAIPLAFVSYVMLICYSLFIPIMGRGGAASNPEIMISLFGVIYAILMFGFIIPIFGIFRKAKIILSSFMVVFLVCFILMFTGVCFPYRAETAPQRQAFFHAKRIMHSFDGTTRKEDSGYYAIAWDRQSTHTLNEMMEKFSMTKRDSSKDCDMELYCGITLYHPFMISYLSIGFWIDAKPPAIDRRPELTFRSRSMTQKQGIYQYRFEVLGTKQMEILIKPIKGAYLTGWSFKMSDTPKFSGKTDEEYFIHYRFGLEMHVVEFSIDLNVPTGTLAPHLVIGLIGHYTDTERSSELSKFMNEFPKWTFVQSVEASYESWEF